MSTERSKDEARQKRFEFQFPLLMLKTEVFTDLYNRLGTWRVLRLFSWGALISLPIVAIFSLYIMLNSFYIMLTLPVAREVGREISPLVYISLPGINPYLPILYGWLGIIVAIMVHEGAHGFIARNIGIKIKSSVLLFFLVIPIGAGVDIDEEQMEKAKAKDANRVLAAGVGGNMVVAIVCLMMVLVITSGLTPVVDGLYIIKVTQGMPAEDAGLLVGDVIVMIDDKSVITLNDLASVLGNNSQGDFVKVTVMRGEKWADRLSLSVKLTDYEGRPVMGVILAEMLIKQRLNIYHNTPLINFQLPTLGFSRSLIPFSEALHVYYKHLIGDYWYIMANIFFWIWFINVNIAIFNALPIYPLDGGRVFRNLLKSLLIRRTNEKTISRLTNFVTVVLLSIILTTIVLPYII